MTGRQALLAAFDRLFDAAGTKLDVSFSDEERADARRQFERRFGPALETVGQIELDELPEQAMGQMEDAVKQLAPADIAGVIATIPLAQQTQEMLRVITVRAAQQRLLEHVAMQADTRFGGN